MRRELFSEATLALVTLCVASATAVGQVAAPVLSPGEGDSAAVFDVTLTCPTAGAQLRYTLNGAEPTIYDLQIQTGGTIRVDRNLTIKAKAWLAGQGSPTTTATYTLTGDVAAGGAHALALAWSGSVWSWGEQSLGKLGNGVIAAGNVLTPTSSLYDVTVPITNGVRIAAGRSHTVVLANDRKVFAFGDNTSGALGNNATADSAYAVKVLKSTTPDDQLGDCTAVAAGMDFAMALGSDGSVYTWGKRANGRLGDGGTLGSRKYAEKVEVTSTTFLSGIRSIAAGEGFGLAREKNSTEQAGALGRVWAWGQGTNGQLGDGGTSNRNRAVLVTIGGAPLTDAWEVSAGESHSAILRWKAGEADLDGTVWTFGQQQYGRLGNNQPASGNISTPAVVRKLSDGAILTKIVSVVCGSAHTLALDENGNVWAWGYNAYGALGDNTTIDRARAVPVKGSDGNPLGGPPNQNPDDDIIRIGAGGTGTENFSMAVARNGTLYMWGRNGNGQLGNGTTSTTYTAVPTAVSGMALLPLVPEVTLSLAVNEPQAPGRVTVTAAPTHGSQAGAALIERVDLYLNGQKLSACYPPNWTTTLTSLATGDHHLYGIAYDLGGKSAMSYPLLFEIGQINLGGPGDDPDGDGLTNAEEQLLGTDPGSSNFTGLPGSEVYGYDALDRLIEVSGSRNHSFELDPAGNITEAQ